MEFKNIAKALQRYWWLIVGCVVVGALCGVVVSLTQTKEYTATARLFVSAAGGTSSTEAYQNDQFSQQRTASYARLVMSEQVASRVVDSLGLEMTPTELLDSTTATIIPRTVLFDLAVTNSDPAEAARIANATATEFIAYVRQLETPVGQRDPRSIVTEVSRAEAPTSPTYPKITMFLFYGVLGGLVVGLLATLVLSLMRTKPRSREELAESTEIGSFGPLEVGEMPHEFADVVTTEQFDHFRKLRAQLDASIPDLRMVLVSCVTSRDLAGRVAINLGLSFAETGRWTSVVDTTGTVQSTLGFGAGDDLNKTDFAASISAGGDGRDSMIATADPHLKVAITADPSAAAGVAPRPEMNGFLDQLAHEGIVVIAAPSSDEWSTAAVIGAHADTSIIVVQEGVDTTRQIKAAVRELVDSHARSVATALVEESVTATRN